MAQWNSSSCNPGGTAFPKFQTSAQGAGRTVNVTFQAGSDPSAPGRCGSFSGNNIKLFEQARLPSGQVVHCDRPDILADSLAHELGHLLGLDDSTCSTYMAIATASDGRRSRNASTRCCASTGTATA